MPLTTFLGRCPLLLYSRLTELSSPAISPVQIIDEDPTPLTIPAATSLRNSDWSSLPSLPHRPLLESLPRPRLDLVSLYSIDPPRRHPPTDTKAISILWLIIFYLYPSYILLETSLASASLPQTGSTYSRSRIPLDVSTYLPLRL